jgi:hypothetical protein
MLDNDDTAGLVGEPHRGGDSIGLVLPGRRALSPAHAPGRSDMSQQQATSAPAQPAEPLPMEVEPASFLAALERLAPDVRK